MDIIKDNKMYMQIAQIAAERSYAKRLRVGCVIVKNHSIISFGWNGMPTGYDNCCEMEVDGKLITRPEVQHAELNAIAKLAENGYSSKGAAIPASTVRSSFRSAAFLRSTTTSSIGAVKVSNFSNAPASKCISSEKKTESPFFFG